MDNRLRLGGVVVDGPTTRMSPAGIAISRFLLEHRSEQQEAGMPRQVMCKITVIAAGQALQGAIEKLVVGCEVVVSGFISRANNRQGEYRLVLHADAIELAACE